MKKPLLILLALLLVLALIPAIGLPLWSAREKRLSEIPDQGIYTCDELSLTLTFGRTTILTLPDGTAIEAGIDHGRNMMSLTDGVRTLDGRYEAHLEDGYIELTFENLPIPFDPDHPYRFTADAD